MSLTTNNIDHLVVLGLPPQLNHLLVPGFSVEAGGLVGAGSDDGGLLRGQPRHEGHELAVDVLVVGEGPEALAVLGAVLAPVKKHQANLELVAVMKKRPRTKTASFFYVKTTDTLQDTQDP